MLSSEEAIIVIMGCSIVGFIWAIVNAIWISKIKLQAGIAPRDSYNKYRDDEEFNPIEAAKLNSLLEIASYIEKGAMSFLLEQYRYLGSFCVVMGFIIFFTVEDNLGQVWTTVSYLLGCTTSVLSGYIGMRVAVFSNYRCAYKAQTSMTGSFGVAYRAGCVMGFTLTSLENLILLSIIILYKNYYVNEYRDYRSMYECIAGYGLGGSTIALFGRVGGGIFDKAAEVGCDLIGKLESGFEELTPHNAAVICNSVGNNVGDIAGMGSDINGSLCESSVAALVIAANSPTFYYHPNALYYPLVLFAFAIVVCMLSSMIAFGGRAETTKSIADRLKNQLLFSTILMIPCLWLSSYLTLPQRLFGLGNIDRTPTSAFMCTVIGIVGGLIIGYVTEYYTTQNSTPAREVARACEVGAATNIISGVALGYSSTLIPALLLSAITFVCHYQLGMFGISLASLGILSNSCITIAIDAYSPVADNAGRLVSMVKFGEEVKNKTDMLEQAGCQTSAMGKGIAICSAALVSLSLYGAFSIRSQNDDEMPDHVTNNVDVNINAPLVYSGLLFGAVLPYAFFSLALRSVASAALELVKDCRKQIEENPGIKTGQVKPNYDAIINGACRQSLAEMTPLAAIALGLPFFIGITLGPIAMAGMLPGILISGVTMSLSNTNSGGAWNSARKFIESGNFTVDGQPKRKGSPEHSAAIIGDTVGNPLKNTSGPSLNILIKLSAMFALIFVRYFDKMALLQCVLAPGSKGCARKWIEKLM